MSNLLIQRNNAHNQSDNLPQLLPGASNHFVEMTLVRFALPTATDVMIRVFNGNGQEVTVKKGVYDAGEHHVVLQRAELSEPGLYICQLETPFGVDRRKLMMY